MATTAIRRIGMIGLTALLMIFPAPGILAAGTGMPDPNVLRDTIVDSKPVPSESALATGADLIAYGWFDSSDRQIPTDRNAQSGKLVNFVQTLHVERMFKGRSPRLVRVLSTGIEPMPDADDPLNAVYPGPMIEGTYICFLRKIPSTDAYALIGGWQGVYPVRDGHTIALEGAGFVALGGLTLDQFDRRIKTYR